MRVLNIESTQKRGSRSPDVWDLAQAVYEEYPAVFQSTRDAKIVADAFMKSLTKILIDQRSFTIRGIGNVRVVDGGSVQRRHLTIITSQALLDILNPDRPRRVTYQRKRQERDQNQKRKDK